ncbi:MAG: Ig-like domain-containing protein [Gemmatimonadota bacterium]|nr:Ig-like domain-containing protein [Gemmatimonadota bacterium]MDE2873222.1 Ig-like domain-containing protein [Gemmatimonadota bacterium]
MRRLLPFVGLPLLALLACGDPKPPTVCGELPQVTVNVGNREVVEPCFTDPEGGTLKLSVVIADEDIVAAGLVGARLAITGKAPGTTTIAVTAIDPDSLQATQNVAVLVPNRPPTGSLDDVEVLRGGALTIDLSGSFSDPDGQDLAYTASSSQPAIISAALSGSILTLTAVGQEGSSQISVTASDGEEEVTATFMATVKVPVVVISEDFNTDDALDDWELNDYASAEIDDGYLLLTADSSGFYAFAGQSLGGTATGWTVEVAARVVDEDAQPGLLVDTDHATYTAYLFLVGEADYGGNLGELNYLFAWFNATTGWTVDQWSFGLSNAIDESSDIEISLTMSDSGVKATVDGVVLFDKSTEDYLVTGAEALILVTGAEGDETGVPGGTNWARFLALDFDESSPEAYALPDLSKLPTIQILKK